MDVALRKFERGVLEAVLRHRPRGVLAQSVRVSACRRQMRARETRRACEIVSHRESEGTDEHARSHHGHASAGAQEICRVAANTPPLQGWTRHRGAFILRTRKGHAHTAVVGPHAHRDGLVGAGLPDSLRAASRARQRLERVFSLLHPCGAQTTTHQRHQHHVNARNRRCEA